MNKLLTELKDLKVFLENADVIDDVKFVIEYALKKVDNMEREIEQTQRVRKN